MMSFSINHDLVPRGGAISTAGPLMNVSIAMIVLETIFIILFYFSRYLQKTSMTGIEMTAFMPLGYLSNIGNACIGIRKNLSPGHFLPLVLVLSLHSLAFADSSPVFVKIGVINQPKRTLSRSALLTYGKLWKGKNLALTLSRLNSS